MTRTLQDYSALPWIPKVIYDDCGTPVSFTLTFPQARWRYSSHSEGGWDMATSGVTESFVLRHDRMYTLVLRFTEQEWVEKVEPWLKVIHQQAQEFQVQLDVADAATERTVQLVSPVTGEDIQPEPHEYDGVLTLEVRVRTSDGSTFPYPRFPAFE